MGCFPGVDPALQKESRTQTPAPAAAPASASSSSSSKFHRARSGGARDERYRSGKGRARIHLGFLSVRRNLPCIFKESSSLFVHWSKVPPWFCMRKHQTCWAVAAEAERVLSRKKSQVTLCLLDFLAWMQLFNASCSQNRKPILTGSVSNQIQWDVR